MMLVSADPMNWLLAALTGAGWGAMTLATAWRHHARGRKDGAITGAGQGGLLIGYASQSGTAESLARAAALTHGARVLPLDRIGAGDLAATRVAHFYLSTTGDGDAPDNATGFLARVMAGQPGLHGLSYALLALGDRHYPRFCGFAHRVDGWLRECGATPLFPLVELDRDRPDALADWHERLGADPGTAVAGLVGDQRWRLTARHHLNPGSPGGPLWHLVLVPEGDQPDWQAGDIATVTIPGETGGISRDYSLASLPGSGRAELILREVILPDGQVGRGSHWLTRRLQPGESIALRIRANPGFRVTDKRAPMLLIGNGSGLAGLMAHLRHRAGRPGSGPVWLIHGERSPDHDALFDAELRDLQACGGLARFDRSFSRGNGGARYVQDLVRAEADAVRALVAGGGLILLCGRREGMASDVLAALEDVLGADQTARLITEGRLKRDVY